LTGLPFYAKLNSVVGECHVNDLSSLNFFTAESSIRMLRTLEMRISNGGHTQTLQKLKILGTECWSINSSYSEMPDKIQPQVSR